MGARNDTIGRLAVKTNLTTTLTAALTCLASDFALGGGSAVLASLRLTSPFSLLAGALLGATLYLHHSTALPLAVAAVAELSLSPSSPARQARTSWTGKRSSSSRRCSTSPAADSGRPDHLRRPVRGLTPRRRAVLAVLLGVIQRSPSCRAGVVHSDAIKTQGSARGSPPASPEDRGPRPSPGLVQRGDPVRQRRVIWSRGIIWRPAGGGTRWSGQAGQLRAMPVIFGVQPIASLPGVSASHDAGNAVDDEEDADRNGPDRKDRRAGPDQAIPQVGQVRFGLPGTPGEVQEDQADGGRR